MFHLLGTVLHFFGLGLLILSFFHADISFFSALIITLIGYIFIVVSHPKKDIKKRR